jgi:uncharacterized repeat protein (TIGR02543 family)
MSGNVMEWCLDWYGAYGDAVTDPAGADSDPGMRRVQRGGCWLSWADSCRSAWRGRWMIHSRSRFIGLRVATAVPPQGPFLVNFEAEGGAVSPASMPVFCGSAYGALPEPARPGYAFGGWWTAAGGAGSEVTAATEVTVAEDHTLYAKWAANTYTVAFAAGAGTVSPASAQVTYGAVYGALPAPSRAGHSFGGWWTAAAGAGSEVTAATVVTAAADHALYAKWTANTYTVAFDAEAGAVSPASAQVTYGAVYGALPAPSRAGHSFDGWWTAADGDGSEVTAASAVTAAADHALHAKWVEDRQPGQEITLMCEWNFNSENRIGFPTYLPTYPAKLYLRQELTWTDLVGSNPESGGPFGPGAITTVYDPHAFGGGGTSSATGCGGAFFYPTPVSTTFMTGTRVIDSYFDPPELVVDRPGTQTVEGTLSDEYTDEMLIQNTLDGLHALTGDFEPSTENTIPCGLAKLHFYDRYTGPSQYVIGQGRYKFAISPAAANTTVTWCEEFIPDDESAAAEYTKKTWTGGGAETPVYEIDPRQRGSAKFGTYYIFCVSVDLEFGGLDEPLETTVGGFVPLNRDNDTNKLRTVWMYLQPYTDEPYPNSHLRSWTLELAAVSGGEKIRIWTDADKSGPVSLPATWRSETDELPHKLALYVEGVGMSAAAKDVELRLRWSAGGAKWDDNIRLTVFNVDIIPAETNVCRDAQSATLNLTADSFGVDVEWTVEPETGLDVTSSDITSFTFCPTNSTPGEYTVTARSSALPECYDTCVVRVVKMGLIPDYDRDGVISDSDRQRAVAKEVFRIWINDDKDVGDVAVDDSDKPGHSDGNFSDGVVNGRCDLLDFFPVHVDVSSPLGLFSGYDNVSYRLSQADGAVNVVWTKLASGDAGLFQKAPTDTCGPNLDESSYSAHVTPVTAAGVTLPPFFLLSVIDKPACGVIQLEGRTQTSSPLVLEIVRNGSAICRVELPLSVAPVEEMYDRLSLRNNGSALTTGSEAPPDASDYGNFVFVHGYNVNTDAARAWGSEVFKRMWQSGMRARYTAVTWDGNESQTYYNFPPGVGWRTPDYYANVVNAFEAVPRLASFVHNALEGTGVKVVAGHSLGNMLVSFAIADHGMSVDKYFMLNAAVAAECYDATLSDSAPSNPMVHDDWEAYDSDTWAANWHALFAAPDGRAGLTWKGRFAAVLPVAYNYYSSMDEVFEILALRTPYPGDGYTVSSPNVAYSVGRYSWQKQEAFKGRTASDDVLTAWLTSSDQAGWGFWGEWRTCGTPPGGVYYVWDRMYDAADANTRSPAEIRAAPIFHHNPPEIMQASLSDAQRASLLAYAVPALSAAAGHMVVAPDDIVNVDMNGMGANGWWRTGHGLDEKLDDRWLHSDMKDAAYFYVHPLFDNLVETGGLK